MIEIMPNVVVRVTSPLPPVQGLVPAESGVLVLPVAGPAGPEGPAGRPGPAGNVESVQELIDDAITTHVEAVAPHPAYDDLPSFTLLFENGLI